jgi:hypothetical protein
MNDTPNALVCPLYLPEHPRYHSKPYERESLIDMRHVDDGTGEAYESG